MRTPTISLRDGGGDAADRGSPEYAPYPTQDPPSAHAVRAPLIPSAGTAPPGHPWLSDELLPAFHLETNMPDDENLHRATTHLRNIIDDFLDHLRYVARQDWNEFRQEELLLAQSRYDWFTDELWKLVLEGKHRNDCDCEVCMRLRVEEDR